MGDPQDSSLPARPRRAALRRKTFRDVEIVYDYGTSRMVCSTRDVSDTGAKIELSPDVPLPDRFLVNDPGVNTSHEARPVWRQDHLVGLEFVSRPSPAGPLTLMLRWLRGE